jgi:hypothetical protein
MILQFRLYKCNCLLCVKLNSMIPHEMFISCSYCSGLHMYPTEGYLLAIVSLSKRTSDVTISVACDFNTYYVN